MARDGFGFSDLVFEIMTESMGPMKFRRVTKAYATKIEKADFQNDLPPEAFLSLLIVILGVKADATPISVEESYALSHAEREAFAQAFITEHQELWREKLLQESVNERGEKIVRTVFGDTIINPRQSGEEVIPYVTRLYRDFNKGIVSGEARRMEPQRRMIEERTASLSQEEKELLLKNATLSESLGKTLAQMRALEGVIQTNPMAERAPPIPPQMPSQQMAPQHVPPMPPEMPPQAAAPHHLPPAPQMANPQPYVPMPPVPSQYAGMPVPQPPQTQLEPVVPPIRAMTPLSEASERMNDVLIRIDAVEPLALETLGMLKSLNDASVQILTDFTKSAERNRRSTRRAMFFAMLAILIALAVPFWPTMVEYYKSQQPGYAAAKAAEAARAAQAVADQKQQIDTLKATVEELRAQRAAVPGRFSD